MIGLHPMTTYHLPLLSRKAASKLPQGPSRPSACPHFSPSRVRRPPSTLVSKPRMGARRLCSWGPKGSKPGHYPQGLLILWGDADGESSRPGGTCPCCSLTNTPQSVALGRGEPSPPAPRPPAARSSRDPGPARPPVAVPRLRSLFPLQLPGARTRARPQWSRHPSDGGPSPRGSVSVWAAFCLTLCSCLPPG